MYYIYNIYIYFNPHPKIYFHSLLEGRERWGDTEKDRKRKKRKEETLIGCL